MKKKLLKQISIFLVNILFVSGCSMKNPSVKTGVIGGAIVGTSAVIVLAATDDGLRSSYVPIYIIGAVLWATVGALVGGAAGYVYSKSYEEKMQKLISSQKIETFRK